MPERWAVHHPEVESMIAAIVQTLMPASGAGKEDLTKETARQVQVILDIMPFFLAGPLLVLTVVFDLRGLAAGGRFSRLPSEKRRELAQQWRESRLSLFQDFMQFYQKMTVFIYYSLITEGVRAGHGSDAN